MNPKLLISLALVLCGYLLGCSTIRQDSEKKFAPGENLALPMKFSSYRALYAFIAENNSIPTDADTLFKLAADSEMTILALGDRKLSYIYLVKSHFYNGGISDGIRGVQGNGYYYVLRPPATNYTRFDAGMGFELIGVLAGNTCTLTYSNRTPQFVTHLHSSAFDASQMVYAWNGSFFEPTK